MSRLFTFGCSFTKYKWMTWADILGMQYNEYYNYGYTGAGNVYIFGRFITALAKHKINKDDTVMIMWTNVMREDRFICNNWHLYGNIYTQDFYPKEYIEKYVDEKGFYERDMPLLHAAQVILDGLGCNHHIMSMVDMTSPDQYKHGNPLQNIDHLLELYSDTLNRIKPSVHKVIFNYEYQSRPTPGRSIRKDNHPTPLEHLEYLEKVIPNISLNEEIIDKVKKENIKVILSL